MPGGGPLDAEGLTEQPSSNGLRPPTHEVTVGQSLDSEGHELNSECVLNHRECISRPESQVDISLHHCM